MTDERTYIDAELRVIVEKLNGIERAAELMRQNSATVSNERLQSINTQFHERDVRGERERAQAKAALDAAFEAQQATVNKLSELFKSTTDGLQSNINDLKDRVVAIEATKRGVEEKRDSSMQTTNLTIGLAGLILAAIVFAVGLYLSSKGAS